MSYYLFMRLTQTHIFHPEKENGIIGGTSLWSANKRILIDLGRYSNMFFLYKRHQMRLRKTQVEHWCIRFFPELVFGCHSTKTTCCLSF
jgi:hypothetical protein